MRVLPVTVETQTTSDTWLERPIGTDLRTFRDTRLRDLRATKDCAGATLDVSNRSHLGHATGFTRMISWHPASTMIAPPSYARRSKHTTWLAAIAGTGVALQAPCRSLQRQLIFAPPARASQLCSTSLVRQLRFRSSSSKTAVVWHKSSTRSLQLVRRKFVETLYNHTSEAGVATPHQLIPLGLGLLPFPTFGLC